MIPWKGQGYLSVLYLIGTVGLFDALVTLALGEQQFYQWPWLFGASVVFAAGVNWLFGRRFNKRPLWFDRSAPSKGNPLLARNTFCFVAMDYWSIPMLALGLVLTGQGVFNSF